ncbi:MAG: UDP-3-O-acyl-N-acetylglucosamine deacetylase [Candidatus Omnitrophica bacterium]|nr:UDP-3-O-acyl-N-acetylglucosamine deacetylase [Candidatus Omnitrophota bacterium]
MMQRTIKNTIMIEGIGLQTGNKVSLVLKSSPPDSGINFIRMDLPNKPLLNIQSMEISSGSGEADRRTTLGSGGMQVQTTEHLLAALAGAGIDNIIIETDNVELPGFDGSAKAFLDAIKRSGIIRQDSPKKIYDVKSPVWCKTGDSMLAIFPDDNFKVSYTLSYPGIGVQFFSAIIDEVTFETEIAPARTFCSEAEAAELLKRGLGKGANYDNTLVMAPGGPINNTLRFPDEPVRHKVLDLIGDLYVAGKSLKGHVVAIKSGHALNMELVKRLRS